MVDEGGGKAPEVHGTDVGFLQGVGLVVFDVDDLLVGLSLNMGAFGDGFEVSVLELADAAGDVSVCGEGVVEGVADHATLMILQGEEGLMDGLIGGGAVEVVGVLNGEGFVDEVLAGENGVGGAPGFGASGGEGVSGG